MTSHESCDVVELTGAEPANWGATGRFLLPFEPTDRLPPASERPRVVRPVVLRAVARSTLAGATPAWTSLAAAARARVALLPFQLEPALAVTRGLACRLLLADEVGLGKTIQAGLVLAELLARDRDCRALVVTPAGLREQWREELRDRFGIAADVIDAAGLARSAARLPPGVNPWAVPQVAITSIDFVKRPDVIRALEPLVWDFIAFDEAHTLGGRSDRAAAADLIARRARRFVAITATPHNGDEQAFERLCALGRLGDDDTLLMFRRSRAEAGIVRSRTVRLLRIRPTCGERSMHGALDAYARRVWSDAPSASAAAARLAMMVLARRASSSPASLVRSLERRLSLLETPSDALAAQLQLPLDESMTADDEEPGAELGAPGLDNRSVERQWIERILALARLACANESKIAALKRLLRRAKEPAIVFTEYRDTLEHLATALAADAGPPYESTERRAGAYGPPGIAILHGGLTAAERGAEARRFTHGNARFLLATDAASEGLNLHRRCRLVINLEVPWTPLRLEQRTGRVDRLGQTRRVHAVAFVARDTADESVVNSLAARLGRAERAAPFGDLTREPTRGLTRLSLRDEAAREAERLALWRQLGEPGESRRGPVVSALGRHHATICWALRLLFVDPAGALVWQTIVAAVSDVDVPPARDVAALRRWLDNVQACAAIPLAAASVHAHDAQLARLRADLALAIPPLIARERAIEAAIRRHGGRLAAPLVQAGLFDRRTLRDAHAQRAIADEAAARAAGRIGCLQRLADPRAAGRQLLFAVAL